MPLIKYGLFLFSYLIYTSSALAQNACIAGTILNAQSQTALGQVTIYISENQRQQKSDAQGRFRFEALPSGIYLLQFYAEGYNSTTHQVTLSEGQQLDIQILLERLELRLDAVEVKAQKENDFSVHQLRNVEGAAIYAAKKNEVIEMDQLVANMATNNARQIFRSVAGLNIWENDGAGLQLSIGARGLDPNRTSNFNTRQNGYDISADALGYPESYYTPPTQALERIEVVRGAASLQYGPQFGGLLNFVFKKGHPEKAFEFRSENTLGSFGLWNTFNSIGGSKKGWNYYSFYQRKQGNGWRPNSRFHQNTGYARLSKNITEKLKIELEHTHMDYLAQQPGGLADFEFEQDARQSKRSRNWFEVNWNLSALILDYQLSEKTKLNSRSFFLAARRQALGELGPINRPDPFRERDLVRGVYRNFGNETRLLHRYSISKQLATFLFGFRYYQGLTRNLQGDANDGSDPDFYFLNPDDPERSSYQFPSKNLSLFAENLFHINDRLSITPGARWEYIQTASDGFYKERIFSGGEVVFEQKFEEAQTHIRSLVLLGLGIGYKLSPQVEIYSNFSQNYRSINFTDMAVINPNLVVDSLLKDEKGYNIDLGFRGTLWKRGLRFDASLFFLRYQNRIGLGSIIVNDPIVLEKEVAFRTNIGDARIGGIEAYVEADLWKLIRGTSPSDKFHFSVFTNFSLLRGVYLQGTSSFVGNEVELIPPFSIKTGTNIGWDALKVSYQLAYTGQHFSDATNAEFVADATRGILPRYLVQDLSMSYTWGHFRFQSGINNLADSRYFTRRTAAYPGPGIIPAEGRSYYLTVGLIL